MTETELQALALLNEIASERSHAPFESAPRSFVTNEALCRAIEQHEAFRQEVSDSVEEFNKRIASHGIAGLRESHWRNLNNLIITKPDPLVEVTDELGWDSDAAKDLRAALEARGFEIREKGQ